MGLKIAAPNILPPGIGGTYTKVAVASGNNFPDALPGGLAADQGCPVLLAGRVGLDNELSRYLKGLKLKQIYIFGGSGAVSANVEMELKKFE